IRTSSSVVAAPIPVGSTPLGVAITPADLTFPSVPTSLHVTSYTTTSITLAWNAARDIESGILGYELMIDGTDTAPIPVTTTTYTHSGLSIGSRQTYNVRAINGVGRKSIYSATLVTSTASNVPTGLSASLSSSDPTGSINLSWGSATGASRYKLRVKTPGR